MSVPDRCTNNKVLDQSLHVHNLLTIHPEIIEIAQLMPLVPRSHMSTVLTIHNCIY